MQRPAPANLPPLSPAAQAHSEAAAAHLRAAIAAASGWLPFDHWMAEALYAPGLGYYAAGNVKLAEADARAPAGDFVTAPQLTPLFARTLARQVAQVLRQTDTQTVLEFGAGTGALAEGVLRELDAQGLQDTQYLILEVSADLRAPGRAAGAVRRAGALAGCATRTFPRLRAGQRGAGRDASVAIPLER